MAESHSNSLKCTIINTGIWRCNAQSSGILNNRKHRVRVDIEVIGDGTNTESVLINIYGAGNGDRLISSTEITQENFCGVVVSSKRKAMAILYKNQREEKKHILIKEDDDSSQSVGDLKDNFLKELLTEDQIYENVACGNQSRNMYVLRTRVVMCTLFSKRGSLPSCCWDYPLTELSRSYTREGDPRFSLRLRSGDSALLRTKTCADNERIESAIKRFLPQLECDGVSRSESDSLETNSDSGIEISYDDSEYSGASDVNTSQTISMDDETSLLSLTMSGASADATTCPEKSPGNNFVVGEKSEELKASLKRPCFQNADQNRPQNPNTKHCSCPDCITSLSTNSDDTPVSMKLANNGYANTQHYENTLVENEEITKARPAIPPPPLPKKTYKKDPFANLTDIQRLMMLIERRERQCSDWFTFEELHQVSEMLSPLCPFGKDWRQLMDYARINIMAEDDINAVTAHSGELPAYLFLTLWHKMRPTECTRQCVEDVLRKMGRDDVVRMVFQRESQEGQSSMYSCPN